MRIQRFYSYRSAFLATLAFALLVVGSNLHAQDPYYDFLLRHTPSAKGATNLFDSQSTTDAETREAIKKSPHIREFEKFENEGRDFRLNYQGLLNRHFEENTFTHDLAIDTPEAIREAFEEFKKQQRKPLETPISPLRARQMALSDVITRYGLPGNTTEADLAGPRPDQVMVYSRDELRRHQNILEGARWDFRRLVYRYELQTEPIVRRDQNDSEVLEAWKRQMAADIDHARAINFKSAVAIAWQYNQDPNFSFFTEELRESRSMQLLIGSRKVPEESFSLEEVLTAEIAFDERGPMDAQIVRLNDPSHLRLSRQVSRVEHYVQVVRGGSILFGLPVIGPIIFENMRTPPTASPIENRASDRDKQITSDANSFVTISFPGSDLRWQIREHDFHQHLKKLSFKLDQDYSEVSHSQANADDFANEAFVREALHREKMLLKMRKFLFERSGENSRVFEKRLTTELATETNAIATDPLSLTDVIRKVDVQTDPSLALQDLEWGGYLQSPVHWRVRDARANDFKKPEFKDIKSQTERRLSLQDRFYKSSMVRQTLAALVAAAITIAGASAIRQAAPLVYEYMQNLAQAMEVGNKITAFDPSKAHNKDGARNQSLEEKEESKGEADYRADGRQLPKYFDILTKSEVQDLEDSSKASWVVLNEGRNFISEDEVTEKNLITVKSLRSVYYKHDFEDADSERFMIPTPAGHSLIGLGVYRGEDQKLADLREYQVKADRQRNLYYVEYLGLVDTEDTEWYEKTSNNREEAEEFLTFIAYFQRSVNDGVRASHVAALLPGFKFKDPYSRVQSETIKKTTYLEKERYRPLAAHLIEAGFEGIGRKIQFANQLTLSDLEKIFESESYYSYVPESVNTGNTIVPMTPENPFFKWSKFAHQGRACFQCDGASELFVAFLDEYYTEPHVRAESRTNYANTNVGVSSIFLSPAELHARTVLIASPNRPMTFGEQPYLEFDTTPSKKDPRNPSEDQTPQLNTPQTVTSQQTNTQQKEKTEKPTPENRKPAPEAAKKKPIERKIDKESIVENEAKRRDKSLEREEEKSTPKTPENRKPSPEGAKKGPVEKKVDKESIVENEAKRRDKSLEREEEKSTPKTPESKLPQDKDSRVDRNLILVRPKSAKEEVDEIEDEFRKKNEEEEWRIRERELGMLGPDHIRRISALDNRRAAVHENWFIRQLPKSHWSKSISPSSILVLARLLRAYSNREISASQLEKEIRKVLPGEVIKSFEGSDDINLFVAEFSKTERQRLENYALRGAEENSPKELKPFANRATTSPIYELLSFIAFTDWNPVRAGSEVGGHHVGSSAPDPQSAPKNRPNGITPSPGCSEFLHQATGVMAK